MLLAPEERVIEHELRGAPWRLLKDLVTYKGPRVVKEAVLDGPGGTGKSRGLGHVFYALMDMYPGLRILVTRKTRESLTDAFLQTWEEDVCPPNHPMLSGASRNNRHNYLFGNGSEMVLGGMDKPSKLYSTSFDIWYCQELFEFTEDEWQKARRALRKWSHPDLRFQLLVGDTNPDAEDHWINVRFQDGKTQRYQSKHEDNPALWDAVNRCFKPEGTAYIESLDSLKFSDEAPGVNYLRLRLGIWCSAEGVVWETYDPEVNQIDRPELPTKRRDGESDIDFARRQAADLAAALDIRWYFAAVDWGFTEPGSMSVYGVDGDKRIYLVAHIYKTGQDIPVWAKWAVELHREFTLRAIVCDPSRPDAIASFNDALGVPRDGPMRIARGANNAKTTSGAGDMAGLDGVRVRFRRAGDGRPRLMFLRDSLRYGRDEKLAKEKKPYDGPREIPSYIYLVRDDGRPTKEQTDPRCADHFCFVAGTMIRMADDTERAIETLRTGDFVWTPNGPERVSFAGSVGVKPTVVLETEIGSIRCTPDHPFVTEHGLTRCDMLSSGHEVHGWVKTGRLSVASTVAKRGGGIPSPRTTDFGISGDKERTCIVSCGRLCTVRSRTRCRFTIGTRTKPTIASRTLSFCRARSTASDISRTRRDSCSGVRTFDGRRDLAGNAISAVFRSTMAESSSLGSAQTRASLHGDALRVSTTSTASAPNADRFSRSTGTRNSGLVPVRVVKINAAAPAKVYNLTVEPSHVYVAGGVLVSNCDELRYACAFVDGGYDLAPIPAPVSFPPTSYGAQLGHAKLLGKKY